ncbi:MULTISPECIES: agmatinase [Acidiplasma]|nr:MULTISPECIES: agmatinase [Acidiplasma]WMT54611.1 MAG: agmatinase [Acidiplasma sp.]
MGGNGKEKNHAAELSNHFSHLKIADAIENYEDSKYVIFGVPFDNTSSYRRGSRLAPNSIRIAYDNLESFEPNYGIDLTQCKISDLGDLPVYEDVSYVLSEVEDVTRIIFNDRKIPVMIGGEHSITVGALRNLKDVSMVIIDAHSDFRDSYFDNKYNHACVTRRALEILGPNKIISVGTRSTSLEEITSPDYKNVRFITANEVRESGISNVISEIKNSISDSVYFSIDMDGIDPAYAPGVGTPEPYGLSSVDVRSILTSISDKIIGFDINEMTPLYDNGNTSMLAAKLIQDFIASREKAILNKNIK